MTSSPKSSTAPSSGAGTGKRSLPPPTTLGDFLLAVLLHVCRKYLLFDLDMKIMIYAIVVIFGSFAHDIAPLPKIYLSQKSNILNLVFVKWSWAWTLLVLGSFVYLTSTVYSAGDKRNVRQHIARMIVGTFVWYTCTTLFVRVGKWSGLCTKTGHTGDYQACLTNGGKWKPFDISGHVFLLIYMCMLNGEECRVFHNWERIKSLLNIYENNQSSPPPELSHLTNDEISLVKHNYDRYTPYIQTSFVLVTLLNLIWEISLVMTTLYYHTAPQKFVAFVIAAASWYCTYRIWYRTELSPGLPGHCKIRYIASPSINARSSRRLVH